MKSITLSLITILSFGFLQAQNETNVRNYNGYWIPKCKESKMIYDGNSSEVKMIHVSDGLHITEGYPVYDEPYGDVFLHFWSPVKFESADGSKKYEYDCLNKSDSVGPGRIDYAPNYDDMIQFYGKHIDNEFMSEAQDESYTIKSYTVKLKFNLLKKDLLEIEYNGSKYLFYKVELKWANK